MPRKLRLLQTPEADGSYAPLGFAVFGTPQPKKPQLYQDAVRDSAWAALQLYRAHHRYGWTPFGNYALGFTVFMPDGRARDNVVKELLAGMQPLVFSSAASVKSFWAHMFHYERQPRVEIVVRRLSDFSSLHKAAEKLLLEAV